jgi:aspartate aminotransferase
MIAERIDNITLSGTMEIAAKAIELQNNGIDIINLSVGEPDLPTPQHIKEAAIKAIQNNQTKYTINTGLVELKDAIRQKFRNDYNAKYSRDEIIVSTGAKQALYNAIQTIISPEDEVIIPAPYYVSYIDMVKLAGGTPVIVNTKMENKFKLTASEFKNNISSKTKAILFCNPSNPTGSVFTKDELQSIVEVALKNNLTIISDEIYEKLIYGTASFTGVASLGAETTNSSIIINGVSKAYSMTGWRIGYACAPKEIVNGMGKLQSHSTSNACTISQHAAIVALNGSQTCVEEQRKIFEERRDFLVKELSKIQNISFNIPDGAFYFFINIEKLIISSKSIKTSRDFCLKLLNESHVATVPGSAFGIEKYLRISYSRSMKELEIAMKRLKDFLG